MSSCRRQRLGFITEQKYFSKHHLQYWGGAARAPIHVFLANSGHEYCCFLPGSGHLGELCGSAA